MSENAAPSAVPAPEQPMSRAVRDTVVRSIAEAQKRNAPLVEAEHLLLALSLADAPAVRVLEQAGLDHAGVEAALRAERDAALRAAGVDPVAPERLAASPRAARPRWGTSARDALVRAHRVASAHRRSRMTHADLLAALAELELGTVPRALELAGVDRTAMRAAALRTQGEAA